MNAHRSILILICWLGIAANVGFTQTERKVAGPTRLDWEFAVSGFGKGSAKLPASYESAKQKYQLFVPKGIKNTDAAMQFIAIASSPEGQAEMSNATAYTPINSEAVPLLKKDMLPFLPLSYRKQEVPADLEYWAKNVDEISKRWYAWQAA